MFNFLGSWGRIRIHTFQVFLKIRPVSTYVLRANPSLNCTATKFFNFLCSNKILLFNVFLDNASVYFVPVKSTCFQSSYKISPFTAFLLIYLLIALLQNPGNFCVTTNSRCFLCFTENPSACYVPTQSSSFMFSVLPQSHVCFRHGFLHQRMNANGSDTK